MDDQVVRVQVVLLVLALVSLAALFATVRATLAAFGFRRLGRSDKWFIGLAWGGTATWLACFAYGVFWEADWVEVTHEVVETAKFPRNSRYRIVHLSDLHVDAPTDALRRLPALVNAEAPDLIVFTGDSLNDHAALPLFQDTLRNLHATDGIIAVQGNHDVWYSHDLTLFRGVATELLSDEPVLRGPIAACGAAYGVVGHVEACLRRNAGKFSLFAYHTPDLVEALAPLGPDLYLAGHTHGGQVRAPVYGAIATFSAFDKKYEMGRYRVGGTTLYVNRGIGFEPGAPRVRFLCRPEVTVIDLVGTGPS